MPAFMEEVCEDAGQTAKDAVKDAQGAQDNVEDAREDLYDTIDALNSAIQDVKEFCAVAVGSVMFGPEAVVAGAIMCNNAVSKMEHQFDVMERKAGRLREREKKLDQAIAAAEKALDGFKHCLEQASEDDGIEIFDEDEDEG